jgi:hypothetical protein
VQENKAAVIAELIRQFDPSYGSEYPIYTQEGEWSYQRFEQSLTFAGVAAWPRLESGRLDVDSDAFRLPGVEGLHALRDSVGFIVKARLQPRWSRSAVAIPIRNDDRTQCPQQEPVQRPRRDALIHEILSGHDRLLLGLAQSRGQRRRGFVRRWQRFFSVVHMSTACLWGRGVAVFEEVIEFSAGGVEGALLIFACVMGDQRSAFVIEGGEHDLLDRALSQPRDLMQVADEFAAKEPQVVAMLMQGFTRQLKTQ